MIIARFDLMPLCLLIQAISFVLLVIVKRKKWKKDKTK